MKYSGTYTKFQNDKERVAFLQKYGLLGVSGKRRNPFMYKGVNVDTPTECNIVGYVEEYDVPISDEIDNKWAEIVISVNGMLVPICSSYLKEMQQANFVRNFEEP